MHTHPSHSLPQSNWTPVESRNTSTKQRSYPAKGDSTVPCESHADATDLSHFNRDVAQAAGSSWSLGGVVPTCGPARAALQPLLGSPALLLSPLGPVTFGSPGREAMKSAGAGRIFSSRPAVGREKHILFHVWFASVCLRAGLQRELAQSTPQAQGLPSADGAKGGGQSICKLGAHWMLHSYKI